VYLGAIDACEVVYVAPRHPRATLFLKCSTSSGGASGYAFGGDLATGTG